MGFKRPFDDDVFQDLPFKQARQVDYGNQLTHFEESVPCHNPPRKPDTLGHYEGRCPKFQCHDNFENGRATYVFDSPKDSDSSAPLSLTTSSSSEEDVGCRAAAYLSLSSDCGESKFQLKPSSHAEDVCTSYLDSFPRKQVPLGPNHQASIPPYSRHINTFNADGSSFSMPHTVPCDDRLIGSCIIPMPDSDVSTDDGYVVGGGRTDCGCLDEGSIRCVRQHVKESREKLKDSIGHEQFMNLGFLDMGEEVMCNWSEEEERIFHAVVYSNPMSLGQNFWKHLDQVFPDRTTKEIVSYYFNVFMLRRRAAQNRSIMLDVDSDDDELHGISRTSLNVQVSEEDGDSDIECPDGPYDQADERGDPLEDEDEEEDIDGSDDDSDGDGDGDGDGDVGDGNGDTTGEDSGIDYCTETPDVQSYDVRRSDAVKHMERNAGIVGEDFIGQDDSCMSFGFEADKIDSCGPADAQANHGNSMAGKIAACGIEVGHGYMLDPSDAKVWDARCTSPIMSFDLLPTCNIIEEIFGKEPAI
ncbi:hypothetical protein Tsubulata_011540 [Turnera subulata]|uniref:Myb-like domain-containing protein n=1 Tax=Turnera subulata TaxID=218843 RepID=A0A9Q0GL96_9ROSI|nr:hypothetical protein Tsubulata_011540 [Turnera subulata]